MGRLNDLAGPVIREVLLDYYAGILLALAGADRDLVLVSALGDRAAVSSGKLIVSTTVIRQASTLARDIIAAYVAGHPTYPDQCTGICGNGIHIGNLSSHY